MLWIVALSHQPNSMLAVLRVVKISLTGTIRSVIHGARTNVTLVTVPPSHKIPTVNLPTVVTDNPGDLNAPGAS